MRACLKRGRSGVANAALRRPPNPAHSECDPEELACGFAFLSRGGFCVILRSSTEHQAPPRTDWMQSIAREMPRTSQPDLLGCRR